MADRNDVIVVGETYLAKNQGTTISPLTVEVVVVWIDDDTVHYRLKGGSVKQTPRDRFLEIIGAKP